MLWDVVIAWARAMLCHVPLTMAIFARNQSTMTTAMGRNKESCLWDSSFVLLSTRFYRNRCPILWGIILHSLGVKVKQTIWPQTVDSCPHMQRWRSARIRSNYEKIGERLRALDSTRLVINQLCFDVSSMRTYFFKLISVEQVNVLRRGTAYRGGQPQRRISHTEWCCNFVGI